MYADTASAACPSQFGSLAMTSITFAAVIVEAVEHCSLNTAYALESSFYDVSSKHDSLFCTSEISARTQHFLR